MPGIFANVTREGSSLFVTIPMRSRMEFYPTSDTQFALKNGDADLLIVKNDKGEVVVKVMVTDAANVQPVECEMTWAWVPKKRN